MRYSTCVFFCVKILGIDPGLATIGFSFLQEKKLIDFGVITTPSGLEFSQRLVQINEDISELLEAFQPDLVAVEQLFFVQNVTNGLAVAHARGVLLHAFASRGIPLLEVSPKDVKLAVCGYGNAEKRQVQYAIQKIFQLPQIPKPDDAADAIAVAYWASANTQQKLFLTNKRK